MTLGAWVLAVAVVTALLVGLAWTMTNGVFRGTRRVPGGSEAGAEQTAASPTAGAPVHGASVLAGTSYDGQRGERATLLQFSSAFCAPCRATRRVLAEVAGSVPGVSHVEVDAESQLDLVRRLRVLRTPTTLVLDAGGHEVTRATGAPRPQQVLAALQGSLG